MEQLNPHSLDQAVLVTFDTVSKEPENCHESKSKNESTQALNSTVGKPSRVTSQKKNRRKQVLFGQLDRLPFSHRVSNSESSKTQTTNNDEQVIKSTHHRKRPPRSLSIPLTRSSSSLFFLSSSLISSSSVLKSSSVTSISGSSPAKPNSSS
jgi:hypothetical protein